MAVTVEQVDVWRRARSEHEQLEFKEAKQHFGDDRLFQYCVAIANEGGGVLLLGIANDPPRPVVGTQAFGNPEATATKIFDKLGFRVDVDAVDHPDGRVLAFQIPSRPRGTAYSVDGKYLMRVGDSLLPMTEDRLRSIFDEGRPDWLTEPAMASVTTEGVVELLDTQGFFELFKVPYPSSRAAVLDRLERDRMIVKQGSTYSISNLAAILFAKRLDSFPGLERKAPRVIVYDGKGKTTTKRDQLGNRGYAVGFAGLVHFVLSQVPTNEVIGQALRKDVSMYPPLMIRECVANALIHQDFLVAGAAVLVEVYDDRVEISNPGQPAVEVDRFIDEFRSRNERLADVMRRIGVCEEKGSGIDKVIDLAEVAQLPAPEFRVDGVRTTCVLFGTRPFAEMGKNDRIRACYQHACLRRVTNATMSNQSLRKRFGLADERAETVSRVLRDTIQAGLIKLEDPGSGSKKYARYLPYWA